jgi:hypothetical protein
MERYSVIEADGSVYGPVDMQGLQGWVTEGRVLRTTIIADSSTGTRGRADTIPNLFPAQPDPLSSVNNWFGTMQSNAAASNGLVWDAIAGGVVVLLSAFMLIGGLMAFGATQQATQTFMPVMGAEGKIPFPAYLILFTMSGLMLFGGLGMIKSKMYGFAITFVFCGIYAMVSMPFQLISAGGMSGVEGVGPALWAIWSTMVLGVFSFVRMVGGWGERPS